MTQQLCPCLINEQKVAQDVVGINWDAMPAEIQEVVVDLNATLEDLRKTVHLLEGVYEKKTHDEESQEETETKADSTGSIHPRIKAVRERLQSHPKTRAHLETHDAYVNGDVAAIEKHINSLFDRLPKFEVPFGKESGGRRLAQKDQCKALVGAIDKYTYYDFFVAFYKDDIDDDGSIAEGSQTFDLKPKVEKIRTLVNAVKASDYESSCEDLWEHSSTGT